MYPVRYEADYAERRLRLRTGLRFILAIPWLLLGGAFVTGALIIALIAWFAIVFTGRHPRGLYDFNAGVLRFQPLDRYSRARTGFRLIVGFPAMFMLYLIGSVWPVAAAIAWFHIVFTGRSAAGTHNVLSYGLAYQLRATATSC